MNMVINLTVSAKTRLVCTSVRSEKNEILKIHEFTHTTKKICMQVFIRPLLEEGRLNYTPSHLPAHGEFKTLCFGSLVPTVCVSCAFV